MGIHVYNTQILRRTCDSNKSVQIWRERESVLSFGMWIRPWKRKASSSKHPRGCGMGKPAEYPVKKTISRIQWKPYNINLDEGFIVIKAQENKITKIKTNKTKRKKKERVRERDSDSSFTKFYNEESVSKSGKHINISKRQHWHTSTSMHPSGTTKTTHTRTYTHLRSHAYTH